MSAAFTTGNDLGAYDYGDPRSPTYPFAAERRASRARQLRERRRQSDDHHL